MQQKMEEEEEIKKMSGVRGGFGLLAVGARCGMMEDCERKGGGGREKRISTDFVDLFFCGVLFSVLWLRFVTEIITQDLVLFKI